MNVNFGDDVEAWGRIEEKNERKSKISSVRRSLLACLPLHLRYLFIEKRLAKNDSQTEWSSCHWRLEFFFVPSHLENTLPTRFSLSLFFSFPSSIFLSSENPFFFSSHAINGQQQVKRSKSTWECVCVCTCFLVHPTLSSANKTHTHTHIYIFPSNSAYWGNRMNFNLKAAGTLLSRAKQVREKTRVFHLLDS